MVNFCGFSSSVGLCQSYNCVLDSGLLTRTVGKFLFCFLGYIGMEGSFSWATRIDQILTVSSLEDTIDRSSI